MIQVGKKDHSQLEGEDFPGCAMSTGLVGELHGSGDHDNLAFLRPQKCDILKHARAYFLNIQVKCCGYHKRNSLSTLTLFPPHVPLADREDFASFSHTQVKSAGALYSLTNAV